MAQQFNPRETITIDVEANPKAAIQEVTKFSRSLSSHMRKAQDETSRLDKGFGRFLKSVGQSRDKAAGLKTLRNTLKQTDAAMQKHNVELGKILAKGRSVGAAGSDERKAARKKALLEAAEYKKEHGITSTRDDKGKIVKMGLRGAKREAEKNVEALGEVSPIDWEEAGETLSEPLHDLLSRDAPTLIKRLAKVAMGAHAVAGKTKDAGKRWSERGSALMKKGGVTGKVAGGALKAGGEMTKVFGGLAKALTSFAPILSVASSFMMSFVKVMIDAEGAAKDYNKQILATTSTAGYLARNFGNAEAASKDLGKSLDMARGAAKNHDLLQSMGTTSEAMASFQAAITAEGVALDKLGRANEGATTSTEGHIKTLQRGVAFSRMFGVSLSEIAQLQGQFMSELGMSADGAAASFQSIADSAAQAGMEANKFFGIVRGFSSDLSLFSLRLEDVTGLLGTMGKNMDPRKMNQFIQTLSQKFGGGVGDNLKYSEMAGEEGRRVVQQDLAQKTANLKKDLQSKLGDSVSEKDLDAFIQAVRANNEKGIAEFRAKHKKELSGELGSSIDSLALMSQRVGSGDKVDQAATLKMLGPLAKMAMQNAISRKNLGGVDVQDISGDKLIAAAGLNITEEDVENARKMTLALQQGLQELINDVSSGQKLTAGQEEQLTKLGINPKNRAGAAKELEKLFKKRGGLDKYMASLSASQQEEVAGAATQEAVDFAKASADLQFSMLDRLGVIQDVLLNKIYDAMQWVGNLVSDILAWLRFGRDKGAELTRAQAVAGSTGSAELQRAFTDVDQTLSEDKRLTAAKNAVIRSARPLFEGLKEAVSQDQALSGKLAVEKDTQKRAKLEDQRRNLKPMLDMYKRFGGDFKKFEKHLYDVSKDEDKGGVVEATRQVGELYKRVTGLRSGEKIELSDEDNKKLDEISAAGLIGGGPSKPVTLAAGPAPGDLPPSAMGNPESFFDTVQPEVLVAANSNAAENQRGSGGAQDVNVTVTVGLDRNADRVLDAKAANAVVKHRRNEHKA